MRSHPGVAARMFRVLADEGINLQLISTSPIKISCLVARAEVEQAVRALHAVFLGGEAGGDRVTEPVLRTRRPWRSRRVSGASASTC